MPTPFYTPQSSTGPKFSTMEKGYTKLTAIRNGHQEPMNMRVRAVYMLTIIDRLNTRRLRGTKAAEACKITVPGLSNLMTGKIENFSLDRLVKIASRLGLKVTINAIPQTSEESDKLHVH